MNAPVSETRLAHVALKDRYGRKLYGFSGPVRITLEEWEDTMNVDLDTSLKTIWYPQFTIEQGLEWTGSVESGGWDYCEVIEVALLGRPKHKVFGPHANPDLARQKALQFLIDQRLVEIISSPRK